MIHEVLSTDDTLDDIRDYVRSSTHEILPSDPAQEDIIQGHSHKGLWVPFVGRARAGEG
jgi:hypothetical protein